MNRLVAVQIALVTLAASVSFGGTSFRWYPSYKGAGQNQFTTNWLDLFQAFQADVATNLAAIMDDGTIPVAKIQGGTNAFTPKTTTISAGDGLTGGGDLSANRTLTVGAGYGISVAADAVAVNTAQMATLVHLNSATGTLASRAEVDGRTNALGLGMVALSNALAEGTVRTSGGTMLGNLYLTNGVILAGADGGVGGNGASITIRSGHAGSGGALGGNLIIDTGFGGSGYGSVYLRRLAPPTTNTDAASKGYVDSAARPLRGPMTVTNDQGSGLATALLTDGALSLSNYAGLGGMVSIFPYDNNQVYIALTNEGAVSVGAKVVVGEPTAAAHAATKGYVDEITNAHRLAIADNDPLRSVIYRNFSIHGETNVGETVDRVLSLMSQRHSGNNEVWWTFESNGYPNMTMESDEMFFSIRLWEHSTVEIGSRDLESVMYFSPGMVLSNMLLGDSINMGGNSISNLAICTEGTEAVNKDYADSRTNTWVTGSAIPVGQFTGQFALSNGASAVYLYIWTGSTWLPAQAGQ